VGPARPPPSQHWQGPKTGRASVPYLNSQVQSDNAGARRGTRKWDRLG
jgi:hypothetical protein